MKNADREQCSPLMRAGERHGEGHVGRGRRIQSTRGRNGVVPCERRTVRASCQILKNRLVVVDVVWRGSADSQTVEKLIGE